MTKVYVVDLTPEEREELLSLLRRGQARVRKTNRARILLLADEGRTDEEVAEALLTSVSTIERTRKRFVEGNLERALNESPRPGGKRKLTGKQEAYLVALACSCWLTDSWSLRLWRRSPTRPSGGRSKGGHQAVGEETVVHPRGGSGVCVAHGGCARALRGALRSEEASRLLRRVALPDGGRETYALASKAWTPAALRLRLRAQGYGQHLCVLRAQERMAASGHY